ncbi:PREDICTED: acanthoscurrin-2-like [Populus euphratica]|uniref:Acanthoscurrin-2-like n=1 Tax=Populus euphratica TaxID=75702 RepID=A0AAJ6T0T8_POPEU|nr:PREDICTED: acanthoscurrin-2-like [Populus euphratica]
MLYGGVDGCDTDYGGCQGSNGVGGASGRNCDDNGGHFDCGQDQCGGGNNGESSSVGGGGRGSGGFGSGFGFGGGSYGGGGLWRRGAGQVEVVEEVAEVELEAAVGVNEIKVRGAPS